MHSDNRAMSIDLPPIYSIANHISLGGQRRTKRQVTAQLVALNLAAVCSVFMLKAGKGLTPIPLDWTGLVAAAAFCAVLVVQIDRNIRKPEQAWYDGRAVAESVKTLAWKYAVGSRPFAIGSETSTDSDRTLARRFAEIVEQMQDLNLSILTGDDAQYITTTMRALRTQPLPIRKEAYRVGRVQDQYDWYSRKANWNRRRIESSNLALIIAVVFGVVASLTRAAGISPLDYLGAVATLIVTVFTLLHLNQHETLARAYHVTSIELSTIKNSFDAVKTEEEWSRFVAEAEEAISREHTLWLASYSTSLEPL